MPEFQQAVAEVLSRVNRPGSFCASGTVDIHLPGLSVDGVGTLALPLLPAQAEQLIAVAEQAPYGRGPETILDTEVRRTWQIDAGSIRITGRRWSEDLERILRAVTEGLGVQGQVQAEPYKLLIYDTGSFFVSHRDTEKAPGMFATLVLALPSEFSGGELVIRHKGDEVRLGLQCDDPSEVAYAAFYADCRHEVLPVKGGYRWALVYNLLRPDGGPLPEAPDHDRERRQLAELLRRWGDTEPGAGLPHKLLCPLEHSYTEAELGFAALKGVDAAAAFIAEAKRRHVEDSIRTHRCDLDTHTDKAGRPYTLVCTKNQASYERRVQQRNKDLANRERLLGAGGGERRAEQPRS
ncbi:MAG: 2OG-Fe(II) oxygenase [Thiohalocapsa sp.]|uniref:2OG-Fe(II) oxygenase n=1 Tax=Thiohalocapsa sp. TaxID=2497641 RepID=UPI0025D31F9C|nr:2OG-Fe(II) oxygenase [Thiohalocapsa sp.]MCG6941648.1 2OG-Fe(II) oxygenase [Thiohalocapsa sp.]